MVIGNMVRPRWVVRMNGTSFRFTRQQTVMAILLATTVRALRSTSKTVHWGMMTSWKTVKSKPRAFLCWPLA